MSQVASLNAELDRALKELRLASFEGGLDSETNPLNLKLTYSPDCQNVKFSQTGRIIGRDGFSLAIASLGVAPDGVAFFYDAVGNKHKALWGGGNIYDVTNNTLIVLKLGAYSSGNRITSVALNGQLFYSDGTTIYSGAGGIRVWDPVVGTDAPLGTSGTSGTIQPPACKVLQVYAGSLIMCNLKYASGGFDKSAMMWCNTNDPLTIPGTNIQQVGEDAGGDINCAIPLAVANTGISPFRTILVGKSQFGLYAYSGALGSLTEILINCPAGVRDGASMRYVPGPDGSGYALFLGTDNKVWGINGSTALEISGPIRTELFGAVQTQLSINVNQPFTAAVNTPDQQYIVDIGGGLQYVYHYQTKAWSRYRGWPSGYWVEAVDNFGQFQLFCADRVNNALSLCNSGITDNGAAIAPYWTSPILTAGSPNVFKIWKWIYLDYRTDNAIITIGGTIGMGAGASSTKSVQPSGASNIGRFDISNWDQSQFGGATGSFKLYKNRARFTVPDSSGITMGSLGDSNVTIKLSTTTPGSRFEILGFSLFYLPRGRKRVAS